MVWMISGICIWYDNQKKLNIKTTPEDFVLTNGRFVSCQIKAIHRPWHCKRQWYSTYSLCPHHVHKIYDRQPQSTSCPFCYNNIQHPTNFLPHCHGRFIIHETCIHQEFNSSYFPSNSTHLVAWTSLQVPISRFQASFISSENISLHMADPGLKIMAIYL